MFRLLVTANVVPSLQIVVIQMMDAISSSETTVLTRATWPNIPEDSILHSQCCENFKSNSEIRSSGRTNGEICCDNATRTAQRTKSATRLHCRGKAHTELLPNSDKALCRHTDTPKQELCNRCTILSRNNVFTEPLTSKEIRDTF
jgi:hypothetical protein